MAAIRAQGDAVVLLIKEHQATLAADVATLFADPRTLTAAAHTLDYQRGRRELRHIRVSTDLTAYLTTHSPWPDIA